MIFENLTHPTFENVEIIGIGPVSSKVLYAHPMNLLKIAYNNVKHDYKKRKISLENPYSIFLREFCGGGDQEQIKSAPSRWAQITEEEKVHFRLKAQEINQQRMKNEEKKIESQNPKDILSASKYKARRVRAAFGFFVSFEMTKNKTEKLKLHKFTSKWKDFPQDRKEPYYVLHRIDKKRKEFEAEVVHRFELILRMIQAQNPKVFLTLNSKANERYLSNYQPSVGENGPLILGDIGHAKFKTRREEKKERLCEMFKLVLTKCCIDFGDLLYLENPQQTEMSRFDEDYYNQMSSHA
ncbi:unnamed protein product [Blepharisma stoltei]|uniref:Uncharacterized protein n=1 Tax=Blepharisma stoltei TaxID=1481888 RepID=A0AAU9JDB1_9CILI|nr:unnamed protein product [Blepharisma stoltei]